MKVNTKNKSLRSKPLVLLFVALFIGAGGYFIINSKAATDISQLNGLLGTDTSYFPISVWLQTPNNNTTINGQNMTVAQAYANAGIDLMNNGDYAITNSFMQAVQNAGQGVISSNQNSGLASSYKSLIKAWGQVDEPDNAQSNGSGGYDPCINPATIVSKYNTLKNTDSTRPVVINYGKGVADTTWGGRGTCTGLTDMYKLSWNGGTGYSAGPAYSAGADIVSYDIYPVNDGYPLTKVADGVDNLRSWTADTKPVWAFLEVTKFDTGNGAPTPAQVRAETWLALTHGAKGLQYFSHIFTPTFIEAGLLTDQNMYNSVKTNNLQIKSLAPQLNSPTITNGATVSSSLRVDKIVKKTGSDTYVFAVTPNTTTGNATFTIPGATTGTVTVIDENRTIAMNNGSFTDSFAAYGVHLYKISSASSGPTANLWIAPSGTSGCTRSAVAIDFASAAGHICNQLQTAYDASVASDLVIIKAGNYTTAFTGGTKSPAPTLKAAQGEAVSIGGINLGSNTGNFILDGVTFGDIHSPQGTQGTATWKNFTIKNSTLSPSAEILFNNCGANNSNILFDHDTFKDQNSATYDGRISFVNSSPGLCGVTIQNSLFQGGARDGVFIAAQGVHILYNTFDNLDPGTTGSHTDGIQCVGGCQMTVDHNYFVDHVSTGGASMQPIGSFDGSDREIVTNNVIDVGPGDSYPYAITLGADNGSIIDHNTLVGGVCQYDLQCGFIITGHKTGSPASHGTIITNNIASNIELGGDSAATIDNNLLTQGSAPSGYGSNNIKGNPTYVGPPSGIVTSSFNSFAMYALTSASLGHNKASNGSDIGANPSSTPTPKPGDTNNDGVVNIIDLSTLLSHYNTNFTAADFNKDNIVNIIDLSTLLSNFGK